MKLGLAPLSLALAVVVPALAFAEGTTLSSREVPARSVPVPSTVSPEMQQLIAAPLDPGWKEVPTSSDEWKARREKLSTNFLKFLPELRKGFGVTVKQQEIGGVNCYTVIPDSLPEANRNRLLIHLHGGYYVFFPGEVATYEAILMAGYAHT